MSTFLLNDGTSWWRSALAINIAGGKVTAACPAKGAGKHAIPLTQVAEKK